MKKVVVRDKDLESYDISNLKLSILLSQDGLSYSIMSVPDSKYLSLISFSYSDKKNFLAEIVDFLTAENLLASAFSETNLIIADPRQTLVPDVLFEQGTETRIWELNFLPDSDSEIKYSYLQKSSNVILFPVRKDLINKFNSLFRNIQVFPSSFPFVESHFTLNKLSENTASTKIFVQVYEEFAEMLILENTSIKLFNTFQYRTNNDLLYFIINVFEQLKLSRENSEISISGFIETDNILVLNLRKFVGLVYFESQNSAFKYFYKFQEIAPHYFYNFLNL
jgi:hypothetical protein